MGGLECQVEKLGFYSGRSLATNGGIANARSSNNTNFTLMEVGHFLAFPGAFYLTFANSETTLEANMIL